MFQPRLSAFFNIAMWLDQQATCDLYRNLKFADVEEMWISESVAQFILHWLNNLKEYIRCTIASYESISNHLIYLLHIRNLPQSLAKGWNPTKPHPKDTGPAASRTPRIGLGITNYSQIKSQIFVWDKRTSVRTASRHLALTATFSFKTVPHLSRLYLARSPQYHLLISRLSQNPRDR